MSQRSSRLGLGLSALALVLGTVVANAGTASSTSRHRGFVGPHKTVLFGTVVNWGGSGADELGNGTVEANSTTPTPPCAPAPAACPGSELSGINTAIPNQISASDDESLAIVNSLKVGSNSLTNAAVTWGSYLAAANSIAEDIVPTPICMNTACSSYLEDVAAVSAGYGWSLALQNGGVMSWGDNDGSASGSDIGVLGNGTTTSSTTPVPVCAVQSTSGTGVIGACSGYLSDVTQISASDANSLAIMGSLKIGDQTVSDAVVDWGQGPGAYSGLGNGTDNSSTTPVPVCAVESGPGGVPCPNGPFLSGVTAISAGDSFNLALLSNGTVVAWGNGNNDSPGGNALGDAQPPSNSSTCPPLAAYGNGGPECIATTPVQVCAVDAAFSCAPAGRPVLTGVTAISAGGTFGLALLGPSNNGVNGVGKLPTGTVVSWGVNDESGAGESELGNDTTEGENSPGRVCAVGAAPTTGLGCTSYLTGVKAIAAGDANGLAILSNGKLVSWGGDNYDGELGNGTNAESDEPVRVCAATANPGTPGTLGSFGTPGHPGTPSTTTCPNGPFLGGVTAIAADFANSMAISSLVGVATPVVVTVIPTSGPAETTVTITGMNLANATEVSFNGTPATIVKDTAKKIVCKVPAGATSGPISVTTKVGTATSTSNFTVTSAG